MPQLRALHNKYPRQLVVLGVNAGEPAAKGTAAAKRLQLNFPVLLAGDQVMEKYGASGFPSTYLISPDGRVVIAQVGSSPALWPKVEAAVASFQPPADEPRAGTGGPRKAAQIGHELTFPLPPGPREWLVGREVVIRFKKPQEVSAELVSVSVDGKQVAIFGVNGSYTWDATTVSNGPHKLRISAQTGSGRETWAVEQTVIVDNRPPVDERPTPTRRARS
jgi:hypothetical protein